MAGIKFLELLSKDYPNIKAATAEIINLNAILALPKGTEYFLSDLHGEHEAFVHMLKSASGTIKAKIDEHYGRVLSEGDREDLAALIYNAKAEINRRKKSEKDFDKWHDSHLQTGDHLSVCFHQVFQIQGKTQTAEVLGLCDG